MAISEVATEIIFILKLLEFIGTKCVYPIIVHVDNLGAIYLAKTATMGGQTKHVDIKYHFVRNFVEDGTIKIVFVRSNKNTADVMTKNLNEENFKKHTNKWFKM